MLVTSKTPIPAGIVGLGVGVIVGVAGIGVAVGTSVAVGGIGVAVGNDVAVGGTGVAVGGTGVAVGGIGVAVGGTGVDVGGTGVGGAEQAARNITAISKTSENCRFIFPYPYKISFDTTYCIIAFPNNSSQFFQIGRLSNCVK